MVLTEQGELIQRGPIGVTSTQISPMGYTVEMDSQGLPIFKHQISTYPNEAEPVLTSLRQDTDQIDTLIQSELEKNQIQKSTQTIDVVGAQIIQEVTAKTQFQESGIAPLEQIGNLRSPIQSAQGGLMAIFIMLAGLIMLWFFMKRLKQFLNRMQMKGYQASDEW